MKAVTTIRTHLGLIGLFTLFAVSFVWLNLINPAQRPVLAAAKLSDVQSTILILAVVIPYVGIWLTGLVGYIRLQDYTTLIKKTVDGRPVHTLAKGIFGVLISLPITSLFSSAAQVFSIDDADYATKLRRIGAYIGVAILLWAFYQLMQGTRAMLVATGRPQRHIPRLAVVAYLLLGGLYIYFVLTNPLFESGTTSGHLPAWLVIDSIVLPRLLAWYWGLQATWNLYQYAQTVSGRIYRLAFSYLAMGVGVVTLGIITLQYIQAISAVAKLPLFVILLVVYLVLVVVSAGFMLVARGGKELTRIEEV